MEHKKITKENNPAGLFFAIDIFTVSLGTIYSTAIHDCHFTDMSDVKSRLHLLYIRYCNTMTLNKNLDIGTRFIFTYR